MICREKEGLYISHQQKLVLTGFLLQATLKMEIPVASPPTPSCRSTASLHLTDFGCSGAEAERLIEEMRSIGKKMLEEMQLGSPSSE